MILWGTIVGALLGSFVTGIGLFGVLLGALAGAAAGWRLRATVRAEIANMLARQASQPVAAATATDATDRKADSSVVHDSAMHDDHVPVPDPAVAVVLPPSPPPASAPTPAVAVEPAKTLTAEPVEHPTEPEPNIVERGVAAAQDWLLGGNTIVRLGLIVLFIGLAFLARWAAGSGLLPIEIRLALVAAFGIALLVIGFSRRTARPAFAVALQGGGIAILYLTIFASAAFYPVLPLTAAFALMVLICAGGCALALLQDAQPMAAAAFIGGYAVPVLLSTGGGPVLAMFAYHSLLNLGVLALAWWRPWRSINLIGFLATFGIASAWGVMRYQSADFAVAQGHLILSVLIYLTTAILYARNQQGPSGRMVDSSLLFGVALAGFGLEIWLVGDLPYGTAFAALAFGAVYLVAATVTIRLGGPEFRLLAETMLAIGIGFATLTIPLALGARWTSVAWALEGVGAFWVGMRQARWMSRLFGLLLQFVAVLLFLGTVGHPVAALPFTNPIFITALLVSLPILATAWWLRHPLAQSGSRWAVTYAPAEAALAKPAFLLGFALWCLTLISEVERSLPPTELDQKLTPVFPIEMQGLLAMLVLIVSAWGWTLIGRRTGWRVASWPGRATLVVLFVVWLSEASGWHTFYHPVLYHPGWTAWPIAIALHLHLLWLNDAKGDAAPGSREAMLYRVTHVGQAWFTALLLADWIWYGVDRAALWDSSWASVVFLTSTLAMLLALTLWAGRSGRRWPLDRHQIAYLWYAALPLAVFTYGGALVTAIIAEGDARPLPYVPLLNPVDLVVALSIGALLLWRRTVLAQESLPPYGADLLHGRIVWGALAGLGFVAVNMMWLRFVHQSFGVPWTPATLLDNHVVQAGFAILWTLLALMLMAFAHRRAARPVWLAGAGLLGLVVIKLFLIDLSHIDGGARIVTFIAVGILMLAVGYFAPLPPSAKERP